MYRPTSGPHAGAVRIEITARRTKPPSGIVVVDDEPARRFNGWLGLLGVLAEALDPQSPSGSSGRLDGELPAGGDADLGESV
jgi:hypothetical protein